MNEIESLLHSGADVNTKDRNDFSLLMSFAQKKDLETVDLLLRYGANSNATDCFGFSALDYAIQNNDLLMVKKLIHNGSNITNESYMLAVEKNFKDIVNFFDMFDPNKHVFLKKK